MTSPLARPSPMCRKPGRLRCGTWKEAHLPAAVRCPAGTGAPLVPQKTCSTPGSAPHVGSIGEAIDLGKAADGGGSHEVKHALVSRWSRNWLDRTFDLDTVRRSVGDICNAA